MLSDKEITKAHLEYAEKRNMHEAKRRALDREFEVEEKKHAELRKQIIQERGLVKVGQRIRDNRRGEVWEVINIFINWAVDKMNIRYSVVLESSDSYGTVFDHEPLKHELETGICSLATDKDKTISKTTALAQISSLNVPETNPYEYDYVGITARGRCIAFNAWASDLHRINKEKLRIFRNKEGNYELRNKDGLHSVIVILGVYENYQDLTLEYLL